MTTNELIRDLTISHLHYVERFKNYEVKKVLALMADIDTAIADKLKVADITDWSRARYTRMVDQLTTMQSDLIAGVQKELVKDLKSFGLVEATFVQGSVDKATGGMVKAGILELDIPSPGTLWSAAQSSPLLFENAGLTLSGMLQGLSDATIQAIENTVRYGYALGESSGQIARRLIGTKDTQGVVNWTRNKADTVVRTSMNHMASVAKTSVYKANSDLIPGYQWLSTLDKRTTALCRFRDGQVWYFEESRRANVPNLLPGEVYPPAHLGCRSSHIPLLVTWRELGIDMDEIPETTRASMNGQVPASITYNEWLASQSGAVQREVLGATRYELLKQGVKMDSFYSDTGDWLTLDQLADKGISL